MTMAATKAALLENEARQTEERASAAMQRKILAEDADLRAVSGRCGERLWLDSQRGLPHHHRPFNEMKRKNWKRSDHMLLLKL